MKLRFFIFSTLLGVFAAGAAAAFADVPNTSSTATSSIRCGGKLIGPGELRLRVEHYCGAPDDKTRRVKTIRLGDRGY